MAMLDGCQVGPAGGNNRSSQDDEVGNAQHGSTPSFIACGKSQEDCRERAIIEGGLARAALAAPPLPGPDMPSGAPPVSS